MDLSPILIAGLVPFIALGFGVRRQRIMWIAVTVSFPLSGLIVLAATNGKASGPGLLVVLCGAVAVTAVYGWLRWAEADCRVRRVRTAAVVAVALWLGACVVAVVAADRANAPVAPTVLGYGVVGLLAAALVLLASRDARGWVIALISFGLASVILVPQSAATFGIWRWGLVVLDLGLVTCGGFVLLAGRRSWRSVGRVGADGGSTGADRQPLEAI